MKAMCLLHYLTLPLSFSVLLFLLVFTSLSSMPLSPILPPLLCLLFFLLFYLHFSTLLSTSSQLWPLLPPLPLGPNHLCPLSPGFPSLLVSPSTLLYLLIFLSSLFLFFFPFLSFIVFASSPLHLSCGPSSPITAGGNYAWKLIRRSLNNYPLMQLIVFPFQELCFLFPGSAFLSPGWFSLFLFHCVWLFFGQAKKRKNFSPVQFFSPVFQWNVDFFLSVSYPHSLKKKKIDK